MQPSPTSSSGNWSSPRTETPCPLAATPPSPFALPLPTTHLPSVPMDLPALDIPRTHSGTIRALCVWLLSFSMFSGRGHAGVCLRTPFLSTAARYSAAWFAPPRPSRHPLVHVWAAVCLWALVRRASVNGHVQVYLGPFSILLGLYLHLPTASPRRGP